MDLKNLYEKHKKLRFPDFPENDKFSEWIEDLIEVDAYYAGLILSKLGGSKEKIDKSHFIKLKSDLGQYASIQSDKGIYNQSFLYIESLSELIELANK